jgi:hypothetical protein
MVTGRVAPPESETLSNALVDTSISAPVAPFSAVTIP